MQSAESSDAKIFYSQNGQYLTPESPLPEPLSELQGRRIDVLSDDERGVRLQKGRQSLSREPDGACIPNGGLWSAICYRARLNGFAAGRAVSPPIKSLNPPSFVHSEIPHLYDFVRQYSLGRIVYRNFDPALVIADLALTFCTAKIMVVGKHVNQLDRIHGVLSRFRVWSDYVCDRRPLHIPEGAEDSQLPQVILSTPTEVANLDGATADIMLLLQAETCANERFREMLAMRDGQFRLYGLMNEKTRVSPSESDVMYQVFGPEMVRLYPGKRTRRQLYVTWSATPGSSNSLTKSNEAFSRVCYWNHRRRNERICELATMLRGDADWDCRLLSDAGFCQRLFPRRPVSVAILVDRPRHAHILSTMLPEWHVLAGKESLHGMPGSFRRRVGQRRSPFTLYEQCIILVDCDRNHRSLASQISFDVVIWAGGGQSPAPVPQLWLRTSGRGSHPLLVIDFKDCHNRNARLLSNRRKNQYHQKEFFPPGISASQGRIATFLSRQVVAGGHHVEQ